MERVLILPSTSSARLKAVALVGSCATRRTTMSPSSIGLRPGMSRTATTTSRIVCESPLPANLPKVSATKTIDPTTRAMSSPTPM
jgi:hypothetical protein